MAEVRPKASGTRKKSSAKKERRARSEFTDDQSDVSSTLSSTVSSWLSGVPDYSESTASSRTSLTSVSTIPVTRKKSKKARKAAAEESDSEDSASTIRAAPRSKGKSASRPKAPTGKDLLDDLDRSDSSEDETVISSVVKKQKSKGKKRERSIISDASSEYSDASSLTESNLSKLSAVKKGKRPEKSIISGASSAYTDASSSVCTESTFSMTAETLGPDDSVTVIKQTRPPNPRTKSTPAQPKPSEDLTILPAKPSKLHRSKTSSSKSTASSSTSSTVTTTRLPWYKRLFSDSAERERERYEREEKAHIRRIKNNDKRFQQYIELKKEFIKDANPTVTSISSRTRRRSHTTTAASSEASSSHSNQWLTPVRKPSQPPTVPKPSDPPTPSTRSQFPTTVDPVTINLRPNEPTPTGYKLTYASDELTNNGRGLKSFRNYELDPSHASSSRSAPSWPRLGRSNSTGSQRMRARPPPPPHGWMPSAYGMGQGSGGMPPVLPFMGPVVPGYMPSAPRAPGWAPYQGGGMGGFAPGMVWGYGYDSDSSGKSSDDEFDWVCEC